MDTALIIAIAVVVALALLAIVWLRGREERRRKKAAGLRREALDHDEEATRAEVAAEERRAEADERRTRADRIDPDTTGRERDDRVRDDRLHGMTRTCGTTAQDEGIARARCARSPAAAD